MRTFIIFITTVFLFGCKADKKMLTVPERAELSKDSQIFLGNRLFSEKKCITCHSVDVENKGPSIKTIVAAYKMESGDIVSFLKGESAPIVDTNPDQVAIMKENIDGFLKEISDVELNALATYIMHVDELHSQR